MSENSIEATLRAECPQADAMVNSAFAACVKGRTPFTPLWVLVIATSWQKPERCSFSHERKMLTSAHAPESVNSTSRPGLARDVWFTRQAGAVMIQGSAE